MWDPKEENIKETSGNNLYNAGKNRDISSYKGITLYDESSCCLESNTGVNNT